MALQIDYNTQIKVKDAISMAISYCKDNIETTDSWSREGLERYLMEFQDLHDNIGTSFVIANDPNY